MENQFNDFKQKFIAEAVKLLDDLEGDLIKLEIDFENSELIESVFRYMHTLKGVSSMYGFNVIAEITHKLENIYDLIRENKLKINPNLIQLTLLSSDFIRDLLQENENVSTSESSNYKKINGAISQIVENAGLKLTNFQEKKKKPVNSKTNSTWQITFRPEENIIDRNINIINTFKDLFELGTYRIIQNELHSDENKFTIFLFTDKNYNDIEDALFFINDYCKITKIADFDIFDENEFEKNNIELKKKSSEYKSLEETAIQTASSSAEANLTIDKTEFKHKEIIKSRINVDSAKLDELMYLVSELITTNSQLVLASKNPVYDPLRVIFEKIDNLSKLFRSNTLNLRLVPINEMVLKFQRLVRDLSHELGKNIELITQGTETELDKSTIDSLSDPLMHLIRNCIDHGIEMPEIRRKNNKHEKGSIKITAYHSSNFVFIQIHDDGQGIDIEKIKKKAIEKKIISEDTIISDREAFELIFLPGFSTAESLTQVSGRGVGMDVVKQKITDMRGQIEVNSERGLGTSFTIKLHQTIGILDTMLFKIDDMFFLVPLSDIEVCQLIDYTELEKRKYTGTIPYYDNLIPYVDLYEVFKLKKPECEKMKLLIINRQDNKFAIAADYIIGEHQAVLKSLGEASKKQPYIAVASVLGDGNLAYLIDLTLIQQNYLTKLI